MTYLHNNFFATSDKLITIIRMLRAPIDKIKYQKKAFNSPRDAVRIYTSQALFTQSIQAFRSRVPKVFSPL